MNPDRKHDIFLSYARKDAALMQKVRDSLRSYDLSVWTDENIEPSTSDWIASIEEALRFSGCMIVILTPNVRTAEGVQNEMRLAIMQGVRIFPLMAGDPRASVSFLIAGTQWIDIRTDFVAGIQQIVVAVKRYVNSEESLPPPPLTPLG
jgi:hypothetical protein